MINTARTWGWITNALHIKSFLSNFFYILLCDVGPNVSFSSYMSVADTIDLEQFEDSATFSA